MRKMMKFLRLAVVLASTAMLIVSPRPASAAPACPFPTMISHETDLLDLASDAACLGLSWSQVTNITLTTETELEALPGLTGVINASDLSGDLRADEHFA